MNNKTRETDCLEFLYCLWLFNGETRLLAARYGKWLSAVVLFEERKYKKFRKYLRITIELAHKFGKIAKVNNRYGRYLTER